MLALCFLFCFSLAASQQAVQLEVAPSPASFLVVTLFLRIIRLFFRVHVICGDVSESFPSSSAHFERLGVAPGSAHERAWPQPGYPSTVRPVVVVVVLETTRPLDSPTYDVDSRG